MTEDQNFLLRFTLNVILKVNFWESKIKSEELVIVPIFAPKAMFLNLTESSTHFAFILCIHICFWKPFLPRNLKFSPSVGLGRLQNQS